jgi:predicted nucleic acid-binding protein
LARPCKIEENNRAGIDQNKVSSLWRPQLKDPGDDMVLELAVTAGCNYIITYNVNDFKGIENFGIKAITPKEFLELAGEL